MNKVNLKNVTTDKSFVKHAGVVTKRTKKSVTVSLIGTVNCASCNAKSACGISDTDVKTIEVLDSLNTFKLHESVEVSMGNDMGLKAVFFAYFLPFIVLFLTLVISLNFFKEWQAGLLSLFILVPYYLVLYFSKNFFQRKLKISLLKLH